MPITEPSLPTVKLLFHRAGRTCPFPGCDVPLIDGDGDVMAEVAHIAAAEPLGPRYDPNMTDEERHGYGNLLLLCRLHHRKVDRNPDKYPAAVLQDMKRAGESGEGEELTAAQEQQVMLELREASVASVGQMGGQTAHTIFNYERANQGRQVSGDVASRMLALLRPHSGTRISIWATTGNPEAANFQRQLVGLFHTAGWRVDVGGGFMFFDDHTGLKVTLGSGVSADSQIVRDLWAALEATGQPLVGNRGDMAGRDAIILQVWPSGSP